MAVGKFLKNAFAMHAHTLESKQTEAAERLILPGMIAGKRMTIAVPPKRGVREELLLHTSFREFDPNGRLVVSDPTYLGEPFTAPLGEVMAVTYTDVKETYVFSCRLIRYFNSGRYQFAVLEPVGGVSKIERRDNFRLPVSLPCSIKRREENGPEEISYAADMVDISVGGAKIQLPVLLEQGEEVRCCVTLGEFGQKDYALTVRWTEPVLHANTGKAKAGLQFVRLSKGEDYVLQKFIFGEQLRQHKAARGAALR